MTLVRDSHGWCSVCKAPPAAPCYDWCAERQRVIAARLQKIAADQSLDARQMGQFGGLYFSVRRAQEEVAATYRLVREITGVE